MDGLMAPSVQPKSRERLEGEERHRRRIEVYKRRHDSNLSRYEAMLAGGNGGAVDKQRELTRLLHQRLQDTVEKKKPSMVTKTKPGKGSVNDGSKLGNIKTVEGQMGSAGNRGDTKVKSSSLSQNHPNIMHRLHSQQRPRVVQQHNQQQPISVQQQQLQQQQLVLICQQQQPFTAVRCSSQQQLQQNNLPQLQQNIIQQGVLRPQIQQNNCTTQSSFQFNADSLTTVNSSVCVNSSVPDKSLTTNITLLCKNSQSYCSNPISSTSDISLSSVNQLRTSTLGTSGRPVVDNGNSLSPASNQTFGMDKNSSNVTNSCSGENTKRSSPVVGDFHNLQLASVSLGNSASDSMRRIPHGSSATYTMDTGEVTDGSSNAAFITSGDKAQLQRQQYQQRQLIQQQQLQNQQLYQQQYQAFCTQQKHQELTQSNLTESKDNSAATNTSCNSGTGNQSSNIDVLEGLMDACANNEDVTDECEFNQGELDDLQNFLEDVSGGADFAAGDILHGFDLEAELNPGGENELLSENLPRSSASFSFSSSASLLPQNVNSKQCDYETNNDASPVKCTSSPPSYSSSTLTVSNYPSTNSQADFVSDILSSNTQTQMVNTECSRIANSYHSSDFLPPSSNNQSQPARSCGYANSSDFSPALAKSSLDTVLNHTNSISTVASSSDQQTVKGDLITTATVSLSNQIPITACASVTVLTSPTISSYAIMPPVAGISNCKPTSGSFGAMKSGISASDKGHINPSPGGFCTMEGGGPAAETLKKMAALHRTQTGGEMPGMGGYPMGYYDPYNPGYETHGWNHMDRPGTIQSKTGRDYFSEGFESLNSTETVMGSMPSAAGGYGVAQNRDSAGIGCNPYPGCGPRPQRLEYFDSKALGPRPHGYGMSGLIPNVTGPSPGFHGPGSLSSAPHVQGPDGTMSRGPGAQETSWRGPSPARPATWQGSGMYQADCNDFELMQHHMLSPAYPEAYRMKQQMFAHQNFIQGQQQAYVNHQRQQQMLQRRQQMMEKQRMLNLSENITQTVSKQNLNNLNQCNMQNIGSELMGCIDTDSTKISNENLQRNCAMHDETSSIAKQRQQQQFQLRQQQQLHQQQLQQQMQHESMQQKMAQMQQFQQQGLNRLQQEQIHSMQQASSTPVQSNATHYVGTSGKAMAGGQPQAQTSSPRVAMNADGSYLMGLSANQSASYDSPSMIGMHGRQHVSYHSASGVMQPVHLPNNEQNYMQRYSSGVMQPHNMGDGWAGGVQGSKDRHGGPVSCSPVVGAEACSMVNYPSSEEFFVKGAGNMGMPMQAYGAMCPSMPVNEMHSGMSDECRYNGMFMQ